MAQQLPQLPGLVHDALVQQAKAKASVEPVSSRSATKRPWLALVLFVAGAVTLPLDWQALWHYAPVSSLAMLVALIWLWRAGK
jgi:hypothetical protein